MYQHVSDGTSCDEHSNAIVFGSELIKVPQMMRAGIASNIIAIVIVSLAGIYLVPAFLI